MTCVPIEVWNMDYEAFLILQFLALNILVQSTGKQIKYSRYFSHSI